VALQHVLDDGQAQTGAAGVARAAAVDAVEALGQARQVLGGDAGAGVLHGKARATVGQRLPLHRDPATRRGVTHRVGDQVGQRAVQLGGVTRQLAAGALRRVGGKPQDVRRRPRRCQQDRQGARIGLAVPQQRLHRRPLIQAGQRAAFQP